MQAGSSSSQRTSMGVMARSPVSSCASLFQTVSPLLGWDHWESIEGQGAAFFRFNIVRPFP